ncbi:transcriptional repressor [Lachnospiraceae bacterium MD1]|jgi:Fur family ferric uptake transcriptional regulator|uniref:Transcriptional repressor n=1 Tax=Variimorphobacter saccharofermentans TaxID=2755051 RepID=A0A839JYR6_9FIRM|nr:Fur family transcriptional regulator [Variimorphobacter saccharofermentans]MBB2182504.1 transcriptional repressor [Variimorphobacter saccharofermentans]
MPDGKEQFKLLLKQNGLKVTTQRIAILEVLDSRPGIHLTAEEIYDCVKKKYPEIGIATVYRTIQMLSELNLIDKLNLDDGYVRYEISKKGTEDTCHHHHHLICLDCGRIYAFQDDLLETLEERIKETMGFTVSDHEVKLYGHCQECRDKQFY